MAQGVMAGSLPTMLDIAKMSEPTGVGITTDIVNLLSEHNPILDDLVMVQCNHKTMHQTTVTTELPEAEWRSINQGVGATKGSTSQLIETCGTLETYSDCDVLLADIYGEQERPRFLMNQAKMHISGMSNQMAETMFYGNVATNPKQFNGFATRTNKIIGAANSDYILDAGGADGEELTSIYLVGFAPHTIHGIYPANSKAGLERENLGKQRIQLPDGKYLQVYSEVYRWGVGLCVRDYRYLVRICNISVNDLMEQARTQAIGAPTSIVKLISRASTRLHSHMGVRPAFYYNRTVSENLDIIGMDRSQQVFGVHHASAQFGEDPLRKFWGTTPVKVVDAILNTEQHVK